MELHRQGRSNQLFQVLRVQGHQKGKMAASKRKKIDSKFSDELMTNSRKQTLMTKSLVLLGMPTIGDT